MVVHKRNFNTAMVHNQRSNQHLWNLAIIIIQANKKILKIYIYISRICPTLTHRFYSDKEETKDNDFII